MFAPDVTDKTGIDGQIDGQVGAEERGRLEKEGGGGGCRTVDDLTKVLESSTLNPKP